MLALEAAGAQEKARLERPGSRWLGAPASGRHGQGSISSWGLGPADRRPRSTRRPDALRPRQLPRHHRSLGLQGQRRAPSEALHLIRLFRRISLRMTHAGESVWMQRRSTSTGPEAGPPPHALEGAHLEGPQGSEGTRGGRRPSSRAPPVRQGFPKRCWRTVLRGLAAPAEKEEPPRRRSGRGGSGSGSGWSPREPERRSRKSLAQVGLLQGNGLCVRRLVLT